MKDGTRDGAQMSKWTGIRVSYWEDGSLTGLQGPIFVEADVSGDVNEGVLVNLDETHEAWVVILTQLGPWLITRLGDRTEPGFMWWEWA